MGTVPHRWHLVRGRKEIFTVHSHVQLFQPGDDPRFPPQRCIQQIGGDNSGTGMQYPAPKQEWKAAGYFNDLAIHHCNQSWDYYAAPAWKPIKWFSRDCIELILISAAAFLVLSELVVATWENKATRKTSENRYMLFSTLLPIHSLFFNVNSK